MKSYVLRPTPSETDLKELTQICSGQLAQKLLFHRNIRSADEVARFLKPDYTKHTHDPFLLKDMEKAVVRILKSMAENKKIVIYSDYDSDGIPAGVVMHDFFKNVGYKNFVNYFPHRYEEGYGLNPEAVQSFKDEDVDLIITFDCGIADIEAVSVANKLGLDVIITDHHAPQEKVPTAYAIINPKQAGCTYPEQILCGCGVAFKLVQALLKRGQQKGQFTVKAGMEKWFLDMVGLATLSDMVPLTGENRVFAYYGLLVLRKSPRLGLRALLKEIKVDQRRLSEDDIGFMLSPRINAASRMGHPLEAFNLLTASDEVSAKTMSTYLNGINNERKGVSASLVKEARKIIEERGLANRQLIVVGNPLWRPALLGPVANTLMETYKAPVFVWGRADGEEVKGSCRSSGAVNLVHLMKTAGDIFSAFGGHAAAGGFSLATERVHLLEENLNKAFERCLQEQIDAQKDSTDNSGVIWIDDVLPLEAIDESLMRQIESLQPFGQANPKPLFLFENVTPKEVSFFGKGKNHLQIKCYRNGRQPINAISFFVDSQDFSAKIESGKPMHLVAHIERNYFGGRNELRLRIFDSLPVCDILNKSEKIK